MTILQKIKCIRQVIIVKQFKEIKVLFQNMIWI